MIGHAALLILESSDSEIYRHRKKLMGPEPKSQDFATYRIAAAPVRHYGQTFKDHAGDLGLSTQYTQAFQEKAKRTFSGAAANDNQGPFGPLRAAKSKLNAAS